MFPLLRSRVNCGAAIVTARRWKMAAAGGRARLFESIGKADQPGLAHAVPTSDRPTGISRARAHRTVM